MKYSQSAAAFFDENLNYSWGIPGDAIDVSDEEFAAALDARTAGGTLSVVNGSLVITAASAPTLAQVQAIQIAALTAAYQAAIVAPVSFTTAAGTTATFPQTDQAKNYLSQCIVSGAAAWTMDFWQDVNNASIRPFTYADLQGLSAAFEAAEVPEYEDLMAKIKAVNEATDAVTVQAIVF